MGLFVGPTNDLPNHLKLLGAGRKRPPLVWHPPTFRWLSLAEELVRAALGFSTEQVHLEYGTAQHTVACLLHRPKYALHIDAH